MLQVQQVNVDNKNNSSTKRTKTKNVKDASDDDTEEESDFEDPDEIEVPGGGKDLDTILKITGNPTTSNPEPIAGNINQQTRFAVGCTSIQFQTIGYL